MATIPSAFTLDLAYNDDGSLLAISSQNYDISVWDTGGGRRSAVPPEQSDIFQDVSNLAFKPGSDQFAYIHYGTTDARSRTGAAARSSPKRSGWDGSSIGLAVSADGKTIATYGYDALIRLYDTQTGALTRTFETGVKHIYDAKMTPDGRYLAYSGWNLAAAGASQRIVGGGIRLIDLQSDAPPVQYGVENDPLNAFTVTSDNRLVAYDTKTQRIVYWNLGAPEEKHTLLSNYLPGVGKLALSSDNRLLAVIDSARPNNPLYLYDVTSGEKVELSIDSNQNVPAIAFSPDGQRLVVSFYDANNLIWLEVWDTATHEELFRRQFEAPLNLNAADFSPDGKLIAIASYNALIVLDADSGETYFQTLAPNSASYTVAFADDGRYLATSGLDGVIRLWGVLPGN